MCTATSRSMVSLILFPSISSANVLCIAKSKRTFFVHWLMFFIVEEKAVIISCLYSQEHTFWMNYKSFEDGEEVYVNELDVFGYYCTSQSGVRALRICESPTEHPFFSQFPTAQYHRYSYQTCLDQIGQH